MSASARVILAAASIIDAKTMVILDESSYIKGPKAERTKWITEISRVARYRMILTGTPISQGVEDLFTQFVFLDKRIVGRPNFYSFAESYIVYDKKRPGMIIGSKNMDELSARLAPFSYQVTKAECMDIPRKSRAARLFELTADQERAYQRVKAEFEEALAQIWEEEADRPDPPGRKLSPLESEKRREWITEKRTSIEIFRMFSRLQQVTCGFLGEERLASNRLEALADVVGRIPEEEKVIVWTKYRAVLDDLVATLEPFGAVATFHGGLNERERNEQLQRFRGDARFLVATTLCGGHGLTLNEAARVIFYNNEFKYSTRAQAEDRCHRYGQDRSVLYIDLVARKSIDERIMEAIDQKKNVARMFQERIQKVRDKTKLKEALAAL
jgi:SNF2 family DNA or RNA helicase